MPAGAGARMRPATLGSCVWGMYPLRRLHLTTRVVHPVSLTRVSVGRKHHSTPSSYSRGFQAPVSTGGIPRISLRPAGMLWAACSPGALMNPCMDPSYTQITAASLLRGLYGGRDRLTATR